MAANIRKVFNIEGVEDLATGTFSAGVVEVNAAAAEGEKAGRRTVKHDGACMAGEIMV